ncbi:unnamed protein product [Urochloa decumbens]|uniref:RNA polymerase II C-terminal domain phosphatase-like n=1 Tax=Urochloa decumbens TaxID=240449 RepID=A0ABC8ZT45_9POAL
MGRRRSCRHRFRLRKSSIKQGGNDDGDTRCPPHPGFVRGLCLRCGAKEEDAAEGGAHRVGGVFFLDGVKDEGAEGAAPGGGVGTIQVIPAAIPASPAAAAASIPRASDMGSLLRARKLTLILDLDHTLLNSTGLDDFSPMETCNGFTPSTRDDPRMGLFRLEHYATKLRPFARGFLEQASAMFEMYVYTLGGQDYARGAVKLLDPDGFYFGGGARVVSSEESTRPDRKSLDVIPGAEAAAVVILDDSDYVWPEHRENLIRVDRYIYFASSCRQFDYYGVRSLAELGRDEREHDGALAVMLGVLKRVHQGFFDDSVLGGHCSDVREVIAAARREVLRGCTVAFSRVIPLEGVAGEHPMWKLAEQLGAVCVANADDTVTHVVALDPGTEKARWARENNKFLVNPKWIRTASFRWCRPNEQDFPVTRGR